MLRKCYASSVSDMFEMHCFHQKHKAYYTQSQNKRLSICLSYFQPSPLKFESCSHTEKLKLCELSLMYVIYVLTFSFVENKTCEPDGVSKPKPRFIMEDPKKSSSVASEGNLPFKGSSLSPCSSQNHGSTYPASSCDSKLNIQRAVLRPPQLGHIQTILLRYTQLPA